MYLGCLKGASKSVQVLFNGTDFENSGYSEPWIKETRFKGQLMIIKNKAK